MSWTLNILKRKHPEIKGYKLIADYPGNRKALGTFEPYTSGEYSRYPHIWKPIFWPDVIRDEKLKQLLEK